MAQRQSRKDIINKAAVEFATHFIDTDETDFYGHFIKEEGLDRAEQRGFIAGAEWADKNPKSPWISVEDDLPFNHEELLDSSKRMTFQVFVRYDDGKYGFSCMAKILDEWKWLNSWTKITHWMLIPPFAE